MNSNKPIQNNLQSCWCRSQLESGLSSFTEVKRTSSLVCASRGVYPASLESDRLLPCIEGYLYWWSKHVLPKLKSNEDNSNYFCGREWECVPCLCFLRGLYRVDGSVIVFLVMKIVRRKSSLDRIVNTVTIAWTGQSHKVRVIDWCHLLTVMKKSRIM